MGGGPAGLMAAEVLATAGVAVTVVEHRRSVGRKLLLAGRGGLNLSHTESLDTFLSRYGPAAPQLRAAIEAFGPDDLRAWAASLGQATFVGTSGRVFPEAFRATPLLRAWLARLADLGVTIETGRRWAGWPAAGNGALVVEPDGAEQQLYADVVVLALGGASWPRTGSDGAWVPVVRAAGIDVRSLRAANAGLQVRWTETFAERFAGEPLKNVAVTVGDDRHGGLLSRGDVIVTGTGLEGGPIYAHSAAVRSRLDSEGRATLHLDLTPDRTGEELTQRLNRRRPKDSFASTARRTLGLAPVAAALLREATANNVPTDPVALATLVKAVPLAITGLADIDRAISSAGGIALDEVDDRFMLRRCPGTFVAGEMLDWEAPTGGYLLQATFSTAVAAARGALVNADGPGE